MNLHDFTPARVSLGRTGCSLPTREWLALQCAHARARRAVYSRLDLEMLAAELRTVVPEVITTRSAAASREIYLRRPDLGRELDERSGQLLNKHTRTYDAVFIVADGLSALAVQTHAAGVIAATLKALEAAEWKIAPVVIAEQARVAIGDRIGGALGASLSIVLIGERPGLSSADSLGIYLTWHPRPGLHDAERNCISNIREEGLSYPAAAHTLAFLMSESRRRKLSGIRLKDETALRLSDRVEGDR